MRINTVIPKKALNKAFLKQKPLRNEIDLFKTNLINLLNSIDEIEREENQKNHVRDFLRDTYYKDTNEINTKDTKDLVIHLGKTNKDKVGVIIEAKRPSNKSEMLSAEKPNAKAFQELVLYYLRERIEENNIDIKYCIATNIFEWYIIEASYFEKLFFRNKAFVKEYEQWRDGKKVTKDTTLFYNEIVKPFVDKLDEEIPCTYFDIRNYEKVLKNEDKADDKNLIALFKILSPYHLLKTPFANDSNSLNYKFYRELLHIIGLEEIKEGSKNIISRKKENRNSGSLLESTINAIETEDIFHRIPDLSLYGTNNQERVYNIALELCITWINRILFLKLLEGQLVNYHKGDRQNRFLNIESIHDFDELFKLFHKVLAVNFNERTDTIIKKYSKVPYLNSSLFEISELEDQAIKINSLDNSEQLELINNTILKDIKKKTDKLTTLDYLFKFLDSYDFASEGTSEIQEENKGIINASVLGKVFEKINGYKDGSIFTPGFITMYMCRKSLRLAVIQKFKDKYGWNVEKFEDLKNYLADRKSSKDILEFNTLINSLKMCDPAVGSGHFLVSLLNEIIAIKYELGLLADENGIRITDYEITIENDELILTDKNDDIFEYTINNGKPITKEVQRVQKTLFREKQTIIENCLFGVDINPNSVKICRLRLWIELLKSAYYKEESNYTELETLPNIDINIKCGNSLISRFPLDSDLKKALKSIKYNIEQYRDFVREYKNEKNREVKRGLQKIIDTIKNDFRTEIIKSDKDFQNWHKAKGELEHLTMQSSIFEMSQKEKKKFNDDVKKASDKMKKYEAIIEEIKYNVIYKNAFEWRFEFPEVLNNDGEYEGFDLIIGNPPYIRHEEIKELKSQLEKSYAVFNSSADVLTYFFELGNNILKPKGILSYIVSNKFFKVSYGEQLRIYLLKNTLLHQIIDFDKLNIFDEATVKAAIIQFSKEQLSKSFTYLDVTEKPEDLTTLINDTGIEYQQMLFNASPWVFQSEKHWGIYNKISEFGTPLSDWELKIYRGLLTGLNDAFLIDEETKNKIIAENEKADEIIKPLFRGREVDKYFSKTSNSFIIGTFPSLKLEIGEYRSIENHLLKFGKEKLEQSGNAGSRKKTSNKWFETQDATAYWEEFEKPKLIWKRIGSKLRFCYDESGTYTLDSTCIATGKHLKYLVGVLNSKLIENELNRFAPKTGTGDLIISVQALSPLQIPIPNEFQEHQMNVLVDKIISAKQQKQDTTELENQIDTMVYKLYDLTEEEILIIESH